ncbi:hypothetical protein AB0I72_19765 [Nocardiopsis sp. NPDC049922]|uniref:hypothetical protein n=1 Tax=Nocardiopsis sp. NPDC049922 TaxID=3155157 RepID=UPI00340B3CFF
MTTREQARAQAVTLIAARIADRDRTPLADRADPEPFAASLLAELAGAGIRYVPALRPQDRTAEPPATPAQARAHAATARRRITPRETP